MGDTQLVVRIGTYKVSDPMPKHEFVKLSLSDLVKTTGLVAATQKQLDDQIKSKMRLDPNAKEIRYFYYEVIDE